MCLEAIHYFEGINVTFLEIIHHISWGNSYKIYSSLSRILTH